LSPGAGHELVPTSSAPSAASASTSTSTSSNHINEIIRGIGVSAPGNMVFGRPTRTATTAGSSAEEQTPKPQPKSKRLRATPATPATPAIPATPVYDQFDGITEVSECDFAASSSRASSRKRPRSSSEFE
jgi:hypothetical protein